MWRVVLASSLALSLALGASGAASPPPVVIESVAIGNDAAGTTLRFIARFAEAFDASYLPQTGTAVVMQQDGQRSKCISVSLVRTSVDGGVATYVGQFNFTYRNSSVLSGRADIGGSIYDFSAPLDGKPGILQKSGESSVSSTGPNAVAAAATPIVITPQPVTITPDPATIDPRTAAATAAAEAAARAVQQGAPAPATPTLIDGLAGNTIGLMGLIVVVVAIVSAYVDRKRSLARAATTG